MQSALELHDSEVASIDVNATEIKVRFSAAYIRRSNSRRGIDAGEGYIQSLELRLSAAHVLMRDDGCVGRISDGEIAVDGDRLSFAPIPFDKKGEVQLSLVFTNGSRFEARGNGVTLQAAGEAKFIESFKC